MPIIPPLQLEPDLWALDLGFQDRAGVIAAYLVTGAEGHTLVDTGPGSTLEALERSVAATGAAFEEITQVALTHIHLDHAGAAGTLMRRLPGARLLVHERGARHMVDPSKLLASASRIYGNRMDRLWGAFEATPAERVTVLDDGVEVRAGRRTLRALHTPGHASHHIAFHDPERRTAFTGDVGGVRMQGASYVRPPTPPPDIDVEAWHASIDRLRALRLQAIDLAHFGRFAEPTPHFDGLLRHLDAWTDWTRQRLAEGSPRGELAAGFEALSGTELRAAVPSATLREAYEWASPSFMMVEGIVRYLTRASGSR